LVQQYGLKVCKSRQFEELSRPLKEVIVGLKPINPKFEGKETKNQIPWTRTAGMNQSIKQVGVKIKILYSTIIGLK
jgi:hypothetical protein